MVITDFLFVVNIISFLISLFLSSKLKIEINKEPLPILFFVPLVIAFFFLAGIAVDPLFFIMVFLAGLFLVYYSIKNEEVVLATVKIKKPPILITVIFIANLLGGILFNIARYATSGDRSLLILIFILGIFLVASSRAVLFSLIAYILKQKGYSKISSFFLGIFSFFGLLIALILADKKTYIHR